jgi:predicted amidohydrolase YtcJ
MWCGVNRITTSGRVAAANQKVSREAALRAVTIDAAYSLKLENEIGSIVAGKLANFTILSDNPVTCDALNIKDIKVWGTVVEGKKQPIGFKGTKTVAKPYQGNSNVQFANATMNHVLKIVLAHQD